MKVLGLIVFFTVFLAPESRGDVHVGRDVPILGGYHLVNLLGDDTHALCLVATGDVSRVEETYGEKSLAQVRHFALSPQTHGAPHGEGSLAPCPDGAKLLVPISLLETFQRVAEGTQEPVPPQEVSALIEAAREGDRDLIRRLLREYGDIAVNTPDSSGYNALHWAVREGHEGVVEELLHRREEIEESSMARRRQREGVMTVREQFRHSSYADSEVRDPFGNTPLLLALQKGQHAIVSLLLRRGGARTNESNAHATFLHWAVGLGDREGAHLLLSHGANADARAFVRNGPRGDIMPGGTPLHWSRDVGMTNLLLDYGAYTEIPNARGDRPLVHAVRQGLFAVAWALMDRGADTVSVLAGP